MPLEARPMCPYCKHYHHSFSNDYEDGTVFDYTCEKCSRVFQVTCWVTYAYLTNKPEDSKK